LILDLSRLAAPPTIAPQYLFTFLTSEQIAAFSSNPANELNSEAASLISSQQARCYAAIIEGELAAYAWVAKGNVAAELNSGGADFRGIGFGLPESMAYVFKVLVLPAQRGKSLNGRLLINLGSHLKNEQVEHLITTTGWTNWPYLRSAEKTGFEQLALAGEFIVGSKHFYKLPALNREGLRLLAEP